MVGCHKSSLLQTLSLRNQECSGTAQHIIISIIFTISNVIVNIIIITMVIIIKIIIIITIIIFYEPSLYGVQGAKDGVAPTNQSLSFA